MKLKLILAGACFALCCLFVPAASVSAEELTEQTGHITDPEFAGMVEESMGSIIETMSTAYTINWTIKKKSRKYTGYFKKLNGSYIDLGVELSKTGRAGILDIDGNVRYLEGKSIYHSFAITEDDYYAVFIQNTSSSSMTASGYFVK